MEKAKEGLPDSQFLEIRYEDVCSGPQESFRRIVEFSGLSWSTRFQERIAATEIQSANAKWKSDLSPGQKKMLVEIMQRGLRKYGYL